MGNTIARSIPFAAPFGVDMPPLHGSILLVEDESFVREVTAEILETAGYHVLKARSAAEAIRQFNEHQHEVELLLVDVVLPGRSGCDVVKELKRNAPALKTIFISGYPQNRASQPADQSVYLPKPFSVGLLMQKIRDVITSK